MPDLSLREALAIAAEGARLTEVAVKAERERCAQIVKAEAERIPTATLRRILAAIEKGGTAEP